MKPSAVIEDTLEARARRASVNDSILFRLKALERGERPRFNNLSSMLGWHLAMKSHMEAPPAMDPAAEVIQGSRVDKEERYIWIARIDGLLKRLAITQGSNRGVLLLWLHFRSAKHIGYKVRKGVKIPVMSQGGIPVRELHEHDRAGVGRNRTVADFWRAFALLENAAFESKWIETRVARRQIGSENYYRRADR